MPPPRDPPMLLPKSIPRLMEDGPGEKGDNDDAPKPSKSSSSARLEKAMAGGK